MNSSSRFSDIPQTNETLTRRSAARVILSLKSSRSKNSTSTMRVLALAAALCAVSAFAPIHSRATRAAVAVRVIKVDVEVDWDAVKGGVEKGVLKCNFPPHTAGLHTFCQGFSRYHRFLGLGPQFSPWEIRAISSWTQTSNFFRKEW